MALVRSEFGLVEIAEQVGVDPTVLGYRAAIGTQVVNAGNLYVKLTSSNFGWTKVALGNGVTLDWFGTASAFIQTKVPTLVAATFRSECTDSTQELESATLAGSGTITIIMTKSGGVISSASGATASSFRRLRSKNGILTPSVGNLRTMKWAIAVVAKVQATPATFNHILCDLSDETTADTYLGTLNSTSPTNWVGKVGTASAVDLGVAFDTNWHTLLQIADGTNVTYYLGNQDGSGMVQLGTPQAQSAAPNNPGCFSFYNLNLATAANAEGYVDKALVLTENPA